MKAIVLLCMVVLAISPPIVANAAKDDAKCKQILNDLDKAVGTIDDDATSYWASRANYVDLIFYQPPNNPDNKQKAEQEKSNGKVKKDKIKVDKKSFDNLIASAQAGDCLSPTELSAVVEPTTKHAKRVNFDQFPPEEPSFQGMTGQGPPSMPRN